MKKRVLFSVILLCMIQFMYLGCSKDAPKIYQLTSSKSPENGGTVNPSSGSYESGEKISVTANPVSGYFFEKWSGDYSGTSNPLNFTISRDTDIVANFKKLDTDNDGVPDDIDLCDDTPTGEQVNSSGCSDDQTDSDGDGINDSEDQCPDTADGEDVNEDGCSTTQNDSDGDGVTDASDQCADTPSGTAVDEFGCGDSETDGDEDGVTNDLDQCPNTPSGEAVDPDGCSGSQKDTDEDGVNDDIDQCAGTPSGESVDAEGCSDSQKDTDGDGVTDDEDLCDDTPAEETVNANGCSESQSDKDAPEITNFEVTEITPTSFSVDWTLNEGSKGYIRFGTTSGVYVASTNSENNFLTRHIQKVGGTNPFPLNEATTYFWQIYTEDQFGNTAFTQEYSTTTLAISSQRPFIFANYDDGSDSGTEESGIGWVPTDPNYTYNYTVDWGDGHFDTNVTGDITHNYEITGDGIIYYIKITGTFPRLFFGKDYYRFSRRRNTEIKQWGDIEWVSMEEGCAVEGLIISATDAPNLSKCTSLKRMFASSSMFVPNESFSEWDVSNITDMSEMFRGTNFNKDISSWEVSNVVEMYLMFAGGYYRIGASDPYRKNPFNMDISSWDVSNVTNMGGMFDSSDYNQDISAWDVSNVTNMAGMFAASSFNQDISSWDVSNVESMSYMFSIYGNDGPSISFFDQDISDWDVSSVTNMSGMFLGADFNKSIAMWNVSNVTNMSAMFANSQFNQDISSWDVSNVNNMSHMFNAIYDRNNSEFNFNQDLSKWNVVNVINCMEFSSEANSWLLPKPNFTNCDPGN